MCASVCLMYWLKATTVSERNWIAAQFVTDRDAVSSTAPHTCSSGVLKGKNLIFRMTFLYYESRAFKVRHPAGILTEIDCLPARHLHLSQPFDGLRCHARDPWTARIREGATSDLQDS